MTNSNLSIGAFCETLITAVIGMASMSVMVGFVASAAGLA